MNTSRFFRHSVLALGATVFMLSCFATSAHAEDVDAAKLWTKNCQSCHGPDGKGKTKMGEKLKLRDLSSAEVKAKVTKETAVEAIKNGVKEEGSDKLAMKAFADKLSPAEIDALAAHSLSFQ